MTCYYGFYMATKRRVRHLPIMDRPREKMQRKGAAALSDFELLEAIIGSGNQSADVSQIARQIQKLLAKHAQDLTIDQLSGIKGVSTATATRLLAAIEVAKRYLVSNLEPILTQNDILAHLGDIRNKQQEYLICLSMDGGQRLIAQRTITVGTLDTLLAHPREVFTDPIADRAATIIIAHNHPSGSAKPSPKDITLTQQLIAAGKLLGIPLKDHIIVTKHDHYSFRQHHMV
jgi:DNA repair protein RadC